MSVTIMIGLPGSGKTSWVKKHAYGPYVIVSADHFFEERPGHYNYRIQSQGAAHAFCFRKFLEQLAAQISRPTNLEIVEEHIYVDNTNLSLAEISPYIQGAYAYGQLPRVLYIETDLPTAIERQKHNVPEQTIRVMWGKLKELLEKWPRYWPPLHIIPKESWAP